MTTMRTMRDVVKHISASPDWHKRVRHMPDYQILAIYRDHEKRLDKMVEEARQAMRDHESDPFLDKENP